MRPRPLLLTAAAVLAGAHVLGVLFARPLYRPAELLAALCLLAYAIHDASVPRAGADGARTVRWGLSAAVAVLVAGAAMTVPPAPSEGAGWQILSPEQYDGLIWRARLESLVPVAAVLVFALLLLAMLGRTTKSRAVLRTAIVAAALVAGYALLRIVVIEWGADRVSTTESTSPTWSPAAVALPALPALLLALAAVALAVVTATRRRWRAASGAVLLAAVALIWLGAAIAARDAATLFSPDLITPTDALPQPTEATVAALRWAAAILIVSGLGWRRPID
ncbi:hypothetical protein GCM10020358_27720 [Amorphoplanes nipponensis]|uniref:Uncharacterized protein n=1 Tax=Actinoplanes nipponensis TaxID=135950 RepID=A0A919JBS2_9ACTN|nr:hypothetical protein [Actinoplanes nipponensis]GIE46485.1 hypothetical protein Ani05nite_00190 [Actinoplanes nipponensis]